MKNALLFVTVLIACHSFSQGYRPFLRDSLHWKISEGKCYFCDPGNPNDPNSYYYTNYIYLKTDGDTIVAGNIYKKLIQYRNLTGRPGPLYPGYSECNLLGLLSEDTAARKVYIRYAGIPAAINWCTTDSILFDFSKNVGDTIKWHDCNASLYVVDSIYYSHPFFTQYVDSVRTWHLRSVSPANAPFDLFESIGGTLGFAGSRPSFEGDYSSDLTSFCIGTDALCNFSCPTNIGLVVTEGGTGFRVYPDPFENEITISSGTSYPDQAISIYDVMGQRVAEETIHSDLHIINTRNYSAGLYFYRITVGRQTVLSGKLIKSL